MSVAAVIVTHESRPYMDACLDSLDAQDGAGLTVVVSDSGSTDGVDELCRERGIAFLPGPNRGFGAAVNRALRHQAVRHADYVLVLNPDVTIAARSLAGWIADCDARPDCGIFGPRQLDEDGRRLTTIGREPSPQDYWNGARTRYSDWVYEPRAYIGERRCDWLVGSCMLVRRELLERLGGFDERFFLFSEEVDLCTRVRRAGLGVLYLPSLTVTHRVAGRQFDEHRQRLIVWSQILYARKWHGPGERASMRAAMAARLARQLGRHARTGEGLQEPWVRLCAVLRFRGSRYGPAPEPAE